MGDEKTEKATLKGAYFLGTPTDLTFEYKPKDEDGEDETSAVDSPSHYTSGTVETIEKIEAVTKGLNARAAYLLGNIIKYVDRAGKKGDAAEDLAKANNYAHRLVTGEWRDA